MEKTYRPDEVEGRIYAEWEDAGAFGCGHTRTGEATGESYSIVIPPPNVTGSRHMGHALHPLVNHPTRKRAQHGQNY